MRLVIGTTNQDVLRAAHKANVQAVVTRTAHEFFQESARASSSFLDLRTIADPVNLVAQLLQQHPFLQLRVIANPAHVDPVLYFRLGQMGVADILLPERVMKPDFWTRLAREEVALGVVYRFERSLRPHLMFCEHPLTTVFLPNVHRASVKQLAHATMPNHQISEAAKRRALWAMCQRAGLVPPDTILTGLRTLFIKFVIDDRGWGAEQLSQYLQFTTSRAMWRSVRRRTGLSQRSLTACDFPALITTITTDFLVPRTTLTV